MHQICKQTVSQVFSEYLVVKWTKAFVVKWTKTYALLSKNSVDHRGKETLI